MKRIVIAVLSAPLLLAAGNRTGDAAGWPEIDAKVAEAKAVMVTEPEAALKASDAAMALAAEHPPSPQQQLASATSGWLKGEALIRLNRPREASPVVDEALSKARGVAPGAKLEGDLLKARGSLSAALGRVQPALLDFQHAFRIYQTLNNARSQAIILQDIGSLYSDAHDYSHMLEYYRQSSDVYHDDPGVEVASHNNLAIAFMGLKKPSEAEHEFAKALKLARKLKSGALVTRISAGLAQAQTQLSDFHGAKASLAQAFSTADADPSARSWKQPYVWGAAAQLEADQGHLAAAKKALQQTFAGQDLDRTAPPFREFHETAWRVYSALGDTDQALKHLAAFKRLDDEARDVAASTNAALLGAQFDFANQNLKIVRLRAGQLARDVALAQTRARGQADLTLALGGAGGTVVLLLLFGLFTLRRSRDAIRSANERLEATNAALEHALKAKSQFLATTSHEVRTPLNGILGMTQVILADRSLAEPMRERIELVHGAGQVMLALVNDILDVAKIEKGTITVEKTPMSLAKLVDDTASLWRGKAEDKGLSLKIETDHLPETIVEDEMRLRQILFNLMSNAIKFTDAGAVVLKVRREDKALVFAVTDTGLGIAADDCARIFEPFTQVEGGTARRHGGTGLGLAICRDVARALGGDVELSSREGVGSTFTLRLPLTIPSQERLAAEASQRSDRPASLAEARLLIIEPNPLARSVLRAVLQSEVMHVEMIGDIAEAEQAFAATPRDHIIISGEALAADPQTDAQTLRRLQILSNGASIGLLMTSPSPEMYAAASLIGVKQILQRPISHEALKASLRQVFASEKTQVSDDLRSRSVEAA